MDVLKVIQSPNMDIRDTVDYKQVMSQYQLGPNGGILTALNLFATRFGKVMDFAEAQKEKGTKCGYDTVRTARLPLRHTLFFAMHKHCAHVLVGHATRGYKVIICCCTGTYCSTRRVRLRSSRGRHQVPLSRNRLPRRSASY